MSRNFNNFGRFLKNLSKNAQRQNGDKNDYVRSQLAKIGIFGDYFDLADCLRKFKHTGIKYKTLGKMGRIAKKKGKLLFLRDAYSYSKDPRAWEFLPGFFLGLEENIKIKDLIDKTNSGNIALRLIPLMTQRSWITKPTSTTNRYEQIISVLINQLQEAIQYLTDDDISEQIKNREV